jgi:hypothetical protein
MQIEARARVKRMAMTLVSRNLESPATSVAGQP